MNNRKRQLEIKTRFLILLLTLFTFTPLVLLGIYYFEINWKILIPIEIAAVICIQAVLGFFFRPEKRCPRCNTPVSIYAEKCPNCGLKLLKKCSNCGNIMNVEDTVCKKCGKEYKILIIPDDAELQFDYIPENGKEIESKKVCPHCGAPLDSNRDDQEFCDVCGGKLK
jgi:hypothetical protein